MKRNQQTFKLIIAGIFLTLPLLAGCASSDEGARAGSGASESTLTIQDVWARSEDAGQNSAAYLQITNEGDDDDRLVAASVDLAGSTEVHEVVSEDNVMKMQEVDEVEVPAGETVSLEPGGYHVMMFDLSEDLTAGDQFDLVLTFDQAGEITVTAEVRDHSSGNGHGYRDPGQGGLS
jgi:periplasmic copper chaperone A